MRLKRDAIYCIVLEKWALHFVRLTRDVDEETAARKSDRSFIGPLLSDVFKVRYHCPWYLLFSSGVRRYVWSFFASSSNSLHFCSIHPIASCDSRQTGSLKNRS